MNELMNELMNERIDEMNSIRLGSNRFDLWFDLLLLTVMSGLDRYSRMSLRKY